MFKRFSKFALMTSSVLLSITLTGQIETGLEPIGSDIVETKDGFDLSSLECNTMQNYSADSVTSSLVVGVNSILAQCVNIKYNDVPVLSDSYNADVEITDIGWGADLVKTKIKVDKKKSGNNKLSDEELLLIELTEPNILDGTEGNEVCNSSKKTFMGYGAVKSRNTVQWQVLNDDEHSWSDEKTGFRMYDDRICIAIGQGYALPGDKVDVVMKNGSVLRCIIGDAKAKHDTDPTWSYQRYDGSVIEMIVDYKFFRGTDQYPKELEGAVEKIVLLPKNFKDKDITHRVIKRDEPSKDNTNSTSVDKKKVSKDKTTTKTENKEDISGKSDKVNKEEAKVDVKVEDKGEVEVEDTVEVDELETESEEVNTNDSEVEIEEVIEESTEGI